MAEATGLAWRCGALLASVRRFYTRPCRSVLGFEKAQAMAESAGAVPRLCGRGTLLGARRDESMTAAAIASVERWLGVQSAVGDERATADAR
jgi:hypothetical protein